MDVIQCCCSFALGMAAVLRACWVGTSVLVLLLLDLCKCWWFRNWWRPKTKRKLTQKLKMCAKYFYDSLNDTDDQQFFTRGGSRGCSEVNCQQLTRRRRLASQSEIKSKFWSWISDREAGCGVGVHLEVQASSSSSSSSLQRIHH